MNTNDKISAELGVDSSTLLECPFCRAQPEQLGEWSWHIKHDDLCWILNSGYHCNDGVQFVHSEAEVRIWNLRHSNKMISFKKPNQGEML